jgi:Domain of unknown function (DUF4440)
MRRVLIVLVSLAFLVSLVTPVLADDAAVRKELEARYAELAQALKAKDRTLLQQFAEQATTPDFVSKGPRGTQTRQQMIDQLKDAKQPWEPSRVVHLTITKLTVEGDQAIALIDYHNEGTVSDPRFTGDASRKPHMLVERGTGRDTWAKTDTGWKAKLHEELTAAYTLDGKPFTPPAPPATSRDAEGNQK